MSHEDIQSLLPERTFLLDGGIGTLIQSKTGLQPFRHCYDQLNLTQPAVIQSIHEQYLAAGADLITTNSFSANALSLAHYGQSNQAYHFAKAAAHLAREAADRYMAHHPERAIFVAGSIGPTPREASPREIQQAYEEQINGLIAGGVDLLLFETIVSIATLKIGLQVANTINSTQKQPHPILLSAAITPEGILYSGETLTTFATAVEKENILSIGLNCTCGGTRMHQYIQQLAQHTSHYLTLHPNAGMPDKNGNYPVDLPTFCHQLQPIIHSGLVNIIGGCCGTTPAYIAALKKIIKEKLHKDRYTE